jgi:hypothetical protein
MKVTEQNQMPPANICYFFFLFRLGFTDWAENETGPWKLITPTNDFDWLIQNEC